MLEKIEIKNYKSFKNKTEVEFRPITIFVGPNSAGKSSILKLIKLLTQSYIWNDRNFPLLINGPIVNHYDYENLFYKNSKKLVLNVFYKLNNLKFENDTEWINFSQILRLDYNDVLKISFEFDRDKKIEQNFLLMKLGKVISFNEKETIELLKSLANSIKESSQGNKENKSIFNKKIVGKKLNRGKNISAKFSYKNGEIFIHTEKVVKKEITKHLKSKSLNKLLINQINKKIHSVEQLVDILYREFNLGKYKLKQNKLALPELNSIYNDLDVFFTSEEYSNLKNRKEVPSFLEEELSFSGNESHNFEKEFEFPTDKYSKRNIEKDSIEWQKELLKFSLNKLKEFPEDEKSENLKSISLLKVLYNFFYYHEKRYLISIEKNIQEIFNLIIKDEPNNHLYVSPIRTEPKKNYSAEDLEEYFDYLKFVLDTKGVISEKNFVEIIQEKTAEINKLFFQLNLPYELEITELTENPLIEKRFSIMLYEKNLKKKLFLEETGFGISQILPILYSIAAGKESFNIIEQPELHIHPNTQFKMAELFTNDFPKKTDEPGKEKNYKGKYLIETHSEHLIRGFQIQVAKGKLSPEDIIIYYVDKNDKGISSVKEITLDEKGNFTTEWPEGFLDLTAKAAYELLNNQLDK